jgi:hypothetical protein
MEQLMSLRKKCNVRTPPSNQPSLVWSAHNLATQCANPDCSKELLYLREGRLELLELEAHADDQFPPEEGAFAMRPLPSKLFWLCGGCAKTHMVKRWTALGLVVVLRNPNTADSHPDLVAPPATTAMHSLQSAILEVKYHLFQIMDTSGSSETILATGLPSLPGERTGR